MDKFARRIHPIGEFDRFLADTVEGNPKNLILADVLTRPKICHCFHLAFHIALGWNLSLGGLKLNWRFFCLVDQKLLGENMTRSHPPDGNRKPHGMTF